MQALILTDGDSRSALSGARALHGEGWRVDLAAPQASPWVGTSRSVRSSHRVPGPGHTLDAYASAIARIVSTCRSDVVLAAGDDWLAALATIRDDLPVPVAAPEPHVVDRLLDKLALPDLGRHAGIDVPRTVAADDTSVRTTDLPAIVKPRRHWTPGRLHPGARVEAALVHTRSDARRRIATIRDAGGEPLLQERVTGQLMAISGVANEHELTGVVQQVAIHTCPEPVGVSSRAVTVRPDRALVGGVARLLGELGWKGIFEAQFLVPPGGDPPRLIDLNGRLYGSVALAVAAGCNLPLASAVLAQQGRLPRLPEACTDICYVWLEGEARRRLASRGIQRAERHPPARCTRRVHSVWAANDPLPAAIQASRVGGRALRRLVTGARS